MIDLGYKRCKSYYCLYIHEDTILLIYVDDIVIVGTDMKKIDDLQERLYKYFKINDTG